MSATATRPAGALLVGSIPLDDTDAVLTTAAAHLGTHLRRIPDGETGTRTIWVTWQQGVFAEHPDLEEEPVPEGQYAPFPRYRARAGVDPAAIRFGSLGYARFAIESYERFAALKRAGAIPAHIRFQISLPTPLAPLNNFAAVDQRAALEPAYEDAMLREVDTIADALPHDQIAIQWDIAFEMGFVEGIRTRCSRPGSTTRWAAASRASPGRASACPTTSRSAITSATATSDTSTSSSRRTPGGSSRWPTRSTPRRPGRSRGCTCRSRATAPTRRSTRCSPGSATPETELYLGLVHLTDGEEGTRARIAAAQEFTTSFRRDRVRVRPPPGRHRRAAAGPARSRRGPRRLIHTRGAMTT